MDRLRRLIVIAVLFGVAIVPARAYGVGGALDRSFGDDGRVVTDVLHGAFDTAYAVAQQPNGKLVVAGTGVQTSTSNRWGDYAAVTMDPADDCTFWATGEYIKTTGSFNWSTRIASIKFDSCN
jgi:hypothetical protein